MKKTIEDFLSSSSIRAISALSYRRDLENLARYFAFDFTAIGKKEITSYFESLSRTVSSSSFSRCVSVVKSYFAYLRIFQHLDRPNLHQGAKCSKKVLYTRSSKT